MNLVDLNLSFCWSLLFSKNISMAFQVDFELQICQVFLSFFFLLCGQMRRKRKHAKRNCIGVWEHWERGKGRDEYSNSNHHLTHFTQSLLLCVENAYHLLRIWWTWSLIKIEMDAHTQAGTIATLDPHPHTYTPPPIFSESNDLRVVEHFAIFAWPPIIHFNSYFYNIFWFWFEDMHYSYYYYIIQYNKMKYLFVTRLL